MYTFDDLIDEKIKLEHAKETVNLKERAADVVSTFGGSWLFVGMFIGLVGCWISFNVAFNGFDKYPFTFLNLILGCISIFQAPFILMSQNRSSKIDRERAEHSYKVDLKAELEIQSLHEKLDALSLRLALLSR